MLRTQQKTLESVEQSITSIVNNVVKNSLVELLVY